ncbi:hypothetical protein [Algoriphagus pacificus]|uniref:MotA/TolQ/ExbB proton channel family protein n=1 Tax=Algoriphagus pacificus TaxID=2811234 RepID=A0ABS3CL78_9BACT|nr:hypothetical protein [Algoriphagus pacificus]MBN7817802.1 hypothetical protein [Algoriphagus pacificus]
MDTYDILLYGSYLLIALGAFVSIVMPLIKSLDNPKSLLKTVVGIVGIAVLFFIAYSISSDEVLPKFTTEQINMTAEKSKSIGGMLIMTYILSILAIGGIVFTEFNKAIK